MVGQGAYLVPRILTRMMPLNEDKEREGVETEKTSVSHVLGLVGSNPTPGAFNEPSTLCATSRNEHVTLWELWVTDSLRLTAECG